MGKLKGRKPMELTAENVGKVFGTCLFKSSEIVDGKPTTEPVYVDGIKPKFGFHAERLSGQKLNITDMCDQLADIEKGPSFLNLCNRKDGVQWADSHQTMEQLVALGIGVEVLQYCLPKEMWGILPGGMPMILRKQEKTTDIANIKKLGKKTVGGETTTAPKETLIGE